MFPAWLSSIGLRCPYDLCLYNKQPTPSPQGRQKGICTVRFGYLNVNRRSCCAYKQHPHPFLNKTTAVVMGKWDGDLSWIQAWETSTDFALLFGEVCTYNRLSWLWPLSGPPSWSTPWSSSPSSWPHCGPSRWPATNEVQPGCSCWGIDMRRLCRLPPTLPLMWRLWANRIGSQRRPPSKEICGGGRQIVFKIFTTRV
jgi:hypothetical protein